MNTDFLFCLGYRHSCVSRLLGFEEHYIGHSEEKTTFYFFYVEIINTEFSF
jgi:hypothetical protein